MSATPLEFDQGVADVICERLADGESLRAICKDDALPARSTVFKWLANNETFADQYARAREAQAEAYADEIVEIADSAFANHVDPVTGEGVLLPVDHNRSRLRMDARKWAASKLAPKKYGDKIDVEHSGGVIIVAQDLDEQL